MDIQLGRTYATLTPNGSLVTPMVLVHNSGEHDFAVCLVQAITGYRYHTTYYMDGRYKLTTDSPIDLIVDNENARLP